MRVGISTACFRTLRDLILKRDFVLLVVNAALNQPANIRHLRTDVDDWLNVLAYCLPLWVEGVGCAVHPLTFFRTNKQGKELFYQRQNLAIVIRKENACGVRRSVRRLHNLTFIQRLSEHESTEHWIEEHIGLIFGDHTRHPISSRSRFTVSIYVSLAKVDGSRVRVHFHRPLRDQVSGERRLFKHHRCLSVQSQDFFTKLEVVTLKGPLNPFGVLGKRLIILNENNVRPWHFEGGDTQLKGTDNITKLVDDHRTVFIYLGQMV